MSQPRTVVTAACVSQLVCVGCTIYRSMDVTVDFAAGSLAC